MQWTAALGDMISILSAHALSLRAPFEDVPRMARRIDATTTHHLMVPLRRDLKIPNRYPDTSLYSPLKRVLHGWTQQLLLLLLENAILPDTLTIRTLKHSSRHQARATYRVQIILLGSHLTKCPNTPPAHTLN
ncbi:hypothetical protein BD324DRAFT_369120 [Kockovaella imperatae]|uniref:Uncharacterized protein n=1 Tax=Kockovaella imperatae TaxID=4999 RepID=A0A1Y1UKL5_9TREE|nr:hypothetical protein BD324DRAFT_369120 [Kockovaella imperatae]ORX38600.1 hypothetical protein BD324DRAFT_369120 [Kockovaella imperatae]